MFFSILSLTIKAKITGVSADRVEVRTSKTFDQFSKNQIHFEVLLKCLFFWPKKKPIWSVFLKKKSPLWRIFGTQKTFDQFPKKYIFQRVKEQLLILTDILFISDQKNIWSVFFRKKSAIMKVDVWISKNKWSIFKNNIFHKNC